MTAGKLAQTRFAISVAWQNMLLPNEATLRDWITAIGDGRVLLPPNPHPEGFLNVFTAQLVVEATTLRQATASGLARVESGVRCKAIDLRVTLIRTNDRDEDIFATHAYELLAQRSP